MPGAGGGLTAVVGTTHKLARAHGNGGACSWKNTFRRYQRTRPEARSREDGEGEGETGQEAENDGYWALGPEGDSDDKLPSAARE